VDHGGDGKHNCGYGGGGERNTNRGRKAGITERKDEGCKMAVIVVEVTEADGQ
jgi:hypothetical protein